MEFHWKTRHLDLEQTLESGQCFRWKRQDDGSYNGISGRHILHIRQCEDGVILETRDKSENDYWLDYFDSQTDYGRIIERFSADNTLKAAAEENRGIRILRQEPFETLISFIISQNNNIPRIKGIISRLCDCFGDEISGKYGVFRTFPTAERIAALSPDDLSPLRAGFRVRYILDAAQKVSSGIVDLEIINDMSLDDGREYLKKITGVGDKVADCVLLFAYHKIDAFPSDVWIKRITAEYYADGLPECLEGYRGIAQQYLYEYFRKMTVPENSAGTDKTSERKEKALI